MKNRISTWTLLLLVAVNTLVADTIYIIGADSNSNPCYWSIFPPAPASSFQDLDTGINASAITRALAFSPNKTLYIVGNSFSGEDFTAAVDWTISSTGTASWINTFTGTSSNFQVQGSAIVFAPSGIGYIVGSNDTGNPAYWTISPEGVISGATEIEAFGFATCVGFTSTNQGYIGGTDSSNNACYWSLSPGGVLSGPTLLVGGESGGAAFVYALAVSPLGTTFLVGTTTSGIACYWTISPEGVASSAIELDGGINSNARGIAFLPDGSGMIVGQGPGNVSCYWNLAVNGTASPLNPLPNGSGSGSSAFGVGFSSIGTAYIVGLDDSNQAAYWTIPLLSNSATYHLLDSGGIGIAFGIAIDFELAPNPPQNLSGKYVKNRFGWTYEYCALLNWSPSDSPDVVAYNIYRNDVLIGSVEATKTQFAAHDQKKSLATYAVTAVDDAGHESSKTTITLK